MLLKQIIQALYYDYCYAKAVQAAKFFTVDLSKKPGDNKAHLQLSPITSLLKVLSCIMIDIFLACVLPWVFGYPILGYVHTHK